MRATKEQNKGITLITLVITIVLMMILAGVTIDIANDGGLFDKAEEAVGKTENAIKQEQELINEILDEYFISEEDKVKIPAGLKAGDYVNYTPTTGTYTVAEGEYGSGYTENQTFTTETGENALKWRVLSINEETGEIELVSATSAQVTTSLYLYGADGYNHGVDILNDLCEKLYSNENGATARSINVEDINAKTTYDYTTYIHPETGLKYGDTRQIITSYGEASMKYPNLYSQEKGYGTAGVFNMTGLNGSQGLNDSVTDGNGVTTYSTVIGSTDGFAAGTDPYITFTYYYYKVEDYINTNLGANTITPDLIKTGMKYWIASRSIGSLSYAQPFDIRFMYETGEIGDNVIFSSGNILHGGAYPVRPVVSLSSNATLVKDTVNSTEDTTYWNIEYEF